MIFFVWARDCRRCVLVGIPRDRQMAEDVTRRNLGLEEVPGSEVISPRRARAHDGHATQKAPGRGPVENRKTLLSGLEFRASGSRDPRISRQRAICQWRVRKSLTNTEMKRYPLGGDACVSPAGRHWCCGLQQ